MLSFSLYLLIWLRIPSASFLFFAPEISRRVKQREKECPTSTESNLFFLTPCLTAEEGKKVWEQERGSLIFSSPFKPQNSYFYWLFTWTTQRRWEIVLSPVYKGNSWKSAWQSHMENGFQQRSQRNISHQDHSYTLLWLWNANKFMAGGGNILTSIVQEHHIYGDIWFDPRNSVLQNEAR